ncbi:hypothetical protein [Streptomyces colonosanans]|nr:hypothetical protein [Streptomyces colonosanans]
MTGLLTEEPGIAHLTVADGAGRRPVGDVIEAVVAREVAEDVLHRLTELGVRHRGEVSLRPIHTTWSDAADVVERAAAGEGGMMALTSEFAGVTVAGALTLLRRQRHIVPGTDAADHGPRRAPQRRHE